MEIREPAVLEIQAGKRTITLRWETRAEGRELIAAIARRNAALPGDSGAIDSEPEREEAADELYRLTPAGQERAGAEYTPDAITVRDLLMLASVPVPVAAIGGWTAEQRREAAEWAAAEHLHASDNDGVRRLPVPAHVAAFTANGHAGPQPGTLAAVADAQGCREKHPRIGVTCRILVSPHDGDHVAYGLQPFDPDITWRTTAEGTLTRPGDDTRSYRCPAVSDAGTPCLGRSAHALAHRDVGGYEWGAPDTDDSHPSRWTGPSGMQQPQPVVRVLPSSRCTWWSDPSDDFYGMCVKETGHDREGLDDERVHENEHGIRWTGARWESATAIVAESIATGTPVIIEDDEDIQPPGAGLCADWPGTAPDDGQTYSDDAAAADSGEDEVQPGDPGPSCVRSGCGHLERHHYAANRLNSYRTCTVRNCRCIGYTAPLGAEMSRP